MPPESAIIDDITHENGAPITRQASRVSALEEPVAGPGGLFVAPRRRSNASRASFNGEIPAEDLVQLTRSISAISGHRRAHFDATHHEEREGLGRLPSFPARPKAAKPGPVSTIREVPSELSTPLSTRPPSPVEKYNITQQTSPVASGSNTPDTFEIKERVVEEYPDIGLIKSWRGALILVVTCGAQLLDNIFMTGVNISLPAIQREFDVNSGDLQWLISAYTLTFGGFLLLAGVLSDRYGRKHIFCAGMAWMSIWTIADGFASSFVQLAIFRALQGIGAAMTVPSSVGIISSYFVARDRTQALTIFGASGAVGFCMGLIFGGFLTSSLGWRYVFYLTVIVTSIIGAVGWLILPRDRLEGHARPKLDLLGAGLSTSGLILLSFVLSSGGVYGWTKAFIITLLILSIALLSVFTFVEKKVSNPIMPLSLWKIDNFAAIWVSGFVMYGGYQSVVYYTTLIAQEINDLSAGQTALRFLPMGVTGFIMSLSMSYLLEKIDTKPLLLAGMALCTIAPVPCALIAKGDINFWKHVFPTTVIGVAGTTVVYCTITVVLLASVPTNVKSLCGGMINTAFQIGSGVGLALASAIVQAVDISKGHDLLSQYGTGLWCCVGFAGIGLCASTFGIRSVKTETAGPVILH